MVFMICLMNLLTLSLLWSPSILAEAQTLGQDLVQKCTSDCGDGDSGDVQLLQQECTSDDCGYGDSGDVQLLQHEALFSKPCSQFPQGKKMNCGSGVSLCGVLTLETGQGSGNYKHDTPVVHGLWPQIKPYGDSKCIKPNDSKERISLNCSWEAKVTFKNHEWTDHGECAGVKNKADYFAQVCNLAAGPLNVMEAAKGKDLCQTVQLLNKNYSVWGTWTQKQVMLSACADENGEWKLADIKNFPSVCGQKCVKNKHGPACKTDEDCESVKDCVRCANSGYCTIEQEPAQCVKNKQGPACKTNKDCENVKDCLRCANSGNCTLEPDPAQRKPRRQRRRKR